MASVRDILGRAEAVGGVVTYQGSPAAWLTNAARLAAQGVPVIVNTKGVAPDQTPCIIALADLERLRLAAHQVVLNEARPKLDE